MNALIAASVLVITIGLAICIGIGAGYAAICAILNAFSARRDKMITAVEATPAPSVGD
ncbi:hypothetical protein [Candidatus Korobacter versatilis]|uniref:hypothetical protein n=1 Tax=Candidatus Korobacter versatilis TaxID=658062 RepID=UPI000303C0C5|nr:hypothetical protein [Candidatus Koribacter versatilis]